MAFEQKNMTGALFTNDKKGNDSAPSYKGNCLIDERKLFISAWVKKDRNGKSYMSLSFEPPREQKKNSAEQYRDAAQPVGSDPARQGPLDDPRDNSDMPL